MLMHEFPGISPYLVHFAETLADHFRVVVPSIIGRDGHPNALGSTVQLCVRREVHLFRTGVTSPAVPWLRDLLETRVSQGQPCGVVGMCLSGGFALAIAIDPLVSAAVIAQPAVPVSRLGPLRLPGEQRRAADLGLSPADLIRLSQRAGTETTALCARGYRFAHDAISPPAKLAAAQVLLGDDAMKVVTLHQPNAQQHSTLTGPDRNDTAVTEVIEFLSQRLIA